ncbi:MAG: hypothetical protein ACTSVU_04765 [Promethearchaeota archaeon]
MQILNRKIILKQNFSHLKSEKRKPLKYKIKLKVIKTSSFSQEQRENLWNFYSPHHHISKLKFMDRITTGLDKIGIFYLKKSKKIIGLTGLRNKIVKTSSGKRYNTLYVGLSFILKKYRGNNLIQKITLKYGILEKLRHPFIKLYLWDDTISYKAYFLICKYVNEFYPSVNNETPKCIQEIINELGNQYYPSQFNAQTGCIKKNSQLLDINIREIQDLALKNDFVHYFIEKNKGFYKGDGLLTIIPADFKNLFLYWRKMQKKTKEKKKH